MEFSEIRPIISGALGGIIAIYLVRWWHPWIPKGAGRKSEYWLLDTYRKTIRLANIALLGGMVLGIYLFASLDLPNTDWRPLGLGPGGGCVAALLVLTVEPLFWRGSPREALVAFSIAQKTPMLLLYLLLGLGALGFVLAVNTFT